MCNEVTVKTDQMLDLLRGCAEKPDGFTEVNHDKWNFIAAYYVNTLDYNPDGKHYNNGLEIMHTEEISLCADIQTENYFYEISVEDSDEHMAQECQLDKVEPGYYRCVCGVQIQDTTSTTLEGTEYDSETYYHMLSRTKLSKSDVDFLIEEHKIYPTDEEYAEIVAAHIA